MVMLISPFAFAFALLLPWIGTTEKFNLSPPTLCTLLEDIRPGEQRRIEVSGVYWSSFEHSLLFDPRTPLCSQDIQPVTWVKFSGDILNQQALQEITAGSRSFVTFRGMLFGPGLVEEDDRAIPVVGSFAKRTAFDRYGHLNSFRTQLVVDEIVTSSPVPPDVGLGFFIGPPDLALAPVVREAALPIYPVNARKAGIEGIVELKIVVTKGELGSIDRVSGDRLLFESSRTNIETWRFESSYSGTFLSSFEYQLERRELGANPNVRYEIKLPYSVRLFAPADGW